MGIRALEENLRKTSVPVQIPDEHRVLLEITEAYHGVHQQTEALLREIHHGYVGWAQTLDDLHRQTMGSFYYYSSHERGPEGLTLLSSFYEKIARQADTPGVRARAVGLWLRFVEKVAVEREHDVDRRGLPVLANAMDRIGDVLEDQAPTHARVTPGLKRVVATLARLDGEAEPAQEAATRTLGRGLLRLYDERLLHEDPEDWWREELAREGTACSPERPAGIDRITHEGLRAYRDRACRLIALEPLGSRFVELLTLPDHAQLMRDYLEVATQLKDRDVGLSGVRWLTRILGSDGLAPIHEPALLRMAHMCGDLVDDADPERQQAFVREAMGLSGSLPHRCSDGTLELIRRIGPKVMALGDRETTDFFVERALALGFHHADFQGYTDSWSIRVNAAHAKNIRVYLDLIGANPRASGRLIAALTTWLKVGGACIADTDLLHRDVSRLLAEDLEPVYAHAKRLLRLLPVYFADIGAEGELRRVSTQLDEIQGRSDTLCHFLRKQSHVESNPLLIGVLERVVEYWATGDPEGLRAYLPPSVFASLQPGCTDQPGLHRIFHSLARDVGGVEPLLALDPEDIERRIEATSNEEAVDARKAGLLFRFHRELARKYGLTHDDLIDRLASCPLVSATSIENLQEALARDAYGVALDVLLNVLEVLQAVVLSDGSLEAVEDIYHKRHIAAGIPSMYGSYRETRLEALGLTYRIESLAEALFARRIRSFELTDRILEDLREVSACLAQLMRALRVSGMKTSVMDGSIGMLDEALEGGVRCTEQYLDIFHLLSRGVEEVVQTYFIDFYGELPDSLFVRMAEKDVASSRPPGASALRSSEGFLRSMIAESFGLQHIDNLCGRVIRALNAQGVGPLAGTAGWSPPRHTGSWTVPLDPSTTPGTVRLGNKGANLVRLVRHGFPVPAGFVVTTDFFASRRAGKHDQAIARSLSETVRSDLARLEEQSGTYLGDPDRPLVLSVRGGAAISMPGMLDSLLNVGLNPRLAEDIAERRDRPWAVWDAYRRFIQHWGMSHGIHRDLFDRMIHRAKESAGVSRKARLPADRMRLLALEYRSLLESRGVPLVDDPFEQVLRSIDLVLRSWDSAKARLYRRELHIAEEWGTAVVVQSMVFGNLHERSGTGVVRTRPSRYGPGGMRLHGDFVVQGQGDDVVSGLVATLPITERQRRAQAKRMDGSLEKDFPAVYRSLLRHATRLVEELDVPPQEIEFTFEDDDGGALYLLQTRDVVASRSASVPTFASGAALDRAHVATGIGASGAALSGRVARTQREIDAIRSRHPGEPIILLRPDTVPEDIHLVLQADGLLTSVGGATSHAAVVAKRLSKTCVVGCTELDVYDDEACATLAGKPLSSGDLISINGLDGFIYVGSQPTHPVEASDRTRRSPQERNGGRPPRGRDP